jgi:hypothetical protein
MTELEERISAFIAEETGIKRKRVQLTSRLAQDIRLEGDDAVEFFEKFGEEFHVDLTALGDRWRQHFLPEGGGPSLGWMVVVGAAVIAGGLLHSAAKWIPVWASMIALIAVLCWVYGKFFRERGEEKIPTTVQDLVDAATAGTWIKQYEEPPVALFRTFL